MSFDKTTRNRLAKFVADARGVIADEFTEQFQSLYGISAKGEIAPLDKLGHLDESGQATAALLRERIDYLEKTHPDDKDGTKAAVARLAREQAFTILNRLAAIRMAEKRGLIVESVGQGYQSKGFKVFETVAGSALGDTFHRYRRYLFCLFAELAIDLGVLFDRRSPQALLFPREPALLALLELLHAADLEPLWAEDETIGWIYQYYNDPEERKKMRKESAAPRNSRELAVRNQFFTPRYVVEFLTDNTLGRIWYEMTRGQTRLAEQCRYLVRRPTEVFLKENQVAGLPLPFDEELSKIIGDAREAHRKVFLQAEEEDYMEPIGWVAEAFRGELANLPEDAGDPDTRWVGAAISPEMIDSIIGEPWQPFEDDTKLSRLTNSIYAGNPDPETRKLPVAWAILSAFARTSQHAGGYGRPYWEKLWSFFRSLALHWLQHGPVQEEGLSQEELLKQPVHIPHRPLKDPREIRLLDPACGSMHFGLYAFDLFETIYEEFWDRVTDSSTDHRSPITDHSHAPLTVLYASKDEFMRDVPRMIIENNVHGIDIDPRAVQIAGLSLWLRAQKAWQARGVKPADRPRVRRSNIVCAEPMPGSPEMLEEFVTTLKPDLLGELVKTVFDKMQLAGEAGSLLKIEEEIRITIDTARKEWLKQQDDLLTRKDGSQEEFFDTAEQQVIDALRTYAEQADADSYQRRLFAEDAARGFAFIDLCRKRYDAVVMNPPFGLMPPLVYVYLTEQYPHSYSDLALACMDRGRLWAGSAGLVGAITSRAFLNVSDSEKFRRNVALKHMRFLGDLGIGVMDDAFVDAAAQIISGQAEDVLVIRDARHTAEKGNCLLSFIETSEIAPLYVIPHAYFERMPKARFAYDSGDGLDAILATNKTIDPDYGIARTGGSTFEDERFLRLVWEAPIHEIGPDQTWCWIARTTPDFCQFYYPYEVVSKWNKDGAELCERNRQVNGQIAQARQGSTNYFRPGVVFSRRSRPSIAFRIHPASTIFSSGCGVVFPDKSEDLLFLLGVLNSRFVRAAIHTLTTYSYTVGHIRAILAPKKATEGAVQIAALALDILRAKQALFAQGETDHFFVPGDLSKPNDIRSIDAHCNQREALLAAEASRNARSLDELVAELYGLSNDLDTEQFGIRSENISLPAWLIGGNLVSRCAWILSMLVGTAIGRWDLRYATGERQPPELPDPFDPLPVCPPGMLQNAEGLPAEPKDVPADYPLRLSWPGILVDDENHPEDIVARVREAIEVIWKDRAEAIEQEACGILGVKTLRDYFRRPAAFFADHLKRYSKSRRQAPIYWPLSTKSGSYTLWLYYHRLTDQTLHTCLADFLDPKLRKVQSELDALSTSGGGGTRAGELREFLDELHDLRDEIERVIKLPWKPNLNDGVLITASPLHKLFRLPKWQKDLKACWDKLAKGDYDWAHLAYTIWPSRVEKACEKDRSIAIAHNREDLCKVEPPKPKKKRGKKTEEEEPEEDEPELLEED